MPETFSDDELEAYLEEALAPPEMAAIERALRARPELVGRLAQINARRDAGVHSLGEIWRRHRVSCPTREQLGSFLLGVLDPQHAEYLEFHLRTVGCRLCQANLNDLQRQQAESSSEVASRRTRYLHSSAGYLRRER